MSKNKGKTAEELLQEALVPEEEQRYKVPSNWRWVRLGSVCEVVGGGTPKSNLSEYFEDGDIPWVTPADLSGYTEMFIGRGKRNITELGLKNSSARLMPEGTVLLSSRAPIGYVAIASNEISTNQGFKSFLPSKYVDSKYLYWYLKLSTSYIDSLASGTTFREISGSKCKEIQIPLAPIDEQRRIADKVETLLIKINQAKQLIEEAKETFELRRAAILDKAFRGGLTENWRDEYDVTESAEELIKRINRNDKKKINDIKLDDNEQPYSLPNGWAWSRIGDIFHVQIGSTPSRKEVDYWNGDLPWISSGEVAFSLITDSREKVTALGAEKTRLKLAPKGSVLFGMIGEGKTRGQVAVLDIDSYHNQNVASIWVSNTGIDSYYVYYWLLSQYSKNRQNSSGNNQPAYNKARVEALIIPIPPLEEQFEIMKILRKTLSIEGEVEGKLCLTTELSDIYSAVLTKAFQGQLGTNDLNETNFFPFHTSTSSGGSPFIVTDN